MAATDTVGVFPIANYNNEAGGSQSGLSLNDDTGSVPATTPTLTYTTSGTYNSRNFTPATAGIRRLNAGFIYGNSDDRHAHRNPVAYANYDVYCIY